MKEIDYTQFEMALDYEDDVKKIYAGKHPGANYTFYKLFSGIELLHCQFDYHNHQWARSASYTLPAYMQVAYSHHGILELEINKGRTIWCGPGDLYIAHDISKRHSSDLVTRTFHGFHLVITPESLDEKTIGYFSDYFGLSIAKLYQKVNTLSPMFKIKTFDNAIHICEELYETILAEEIGIMRIKTIELLLLLLRTDLKHLPIYRHFTKETIEKTRQAKTYMDAHLDQNIKIEYLCLKFDLTLTLFKTCFKELFHHAPYDYFLKTRMVKAATLLESTQMDIHSIGLEIGYDNPSSFARAFKNIYHTSPRQFREKQLFSKSQ